MQSMTEDTRISFRMNPEFADWFNRVTAHKMISKSTLLRFVVVEYVVSHPDQFTREMVQEALDFRR